jgi:hypothetical protein
MFVVRGCVAQGRDYGGIHIALEGRGFEASTCLSLCGDTFFGFICASRCRVHDASIGIALSSISQHRSRERGFAVDGSMVLLSSAAPRVFNHSLANADPHYCYGAN